MHGWSWIGNEGFGKVHIRYLCSSDYHLIVRINGYQPERLGSHESRTIWMSKVSHHCFLERFLEHFISFPFSNTEAIGQQCFQ